MTTKDMASKNITKSKVKKTNLSSPSRTAKTPTFEIHYPSEEDWKNLVKVLGLSRDKEAKHKLWEFIGDMVADILHVQKVHEARIERNEGIRRIKNLDVRIQNLKKAIESESKKLTEIIPIETLEQLGELFTIGAASTAAKKRRFPKDPLPAASGEDNKPDLHTLEEIENFYVGLRRDNGLLYGPALLELSLETIHKPIREWLAKNLANPGGRPKKSLRDVMIHRTIIHAEEIQKITPETKKGGRFMTFCNLCLVSCGVPEVGLDKAIAAAINENSKIMKMTTKLSKASRKSKS